MDFHDPVNSSILSGSSEKNNSALQIFGPSNQTKTTSIIKSVALYGPWTMGLELHFYPEPITLLRQRNEPEAYFET